jgi:hypothetical protein
MQRPGQRCDNDEISGPQGTRSKQLRQCSNGHRGSIPTPSATRYTFADRPPNTPCLHTQAGYVSRPPGEFHERPQQRSAVGFGGRLGGVSRGQVEGTGSRAGLHLAIPARASAIWIVRSRCPGELPPVASGPKTMHAAWGVREWPAAIAAASHEMCRSSRSTESPMAASSSGGRVLTAARPLLRRATGRNGFSEDDSGGRSIMLTSEQAARP